MIPFCLIRRDKEIEEMQRGDQSSIEEIRKMGGRRRRERGREGRGEGHIYLDSVWVGCRLFFCQRLAAQKKLWD